MAAQVFDTVAELPVRKGLMLKARTAVDATIIAVSISTKNKKGTHNSIPG